MLESLIFTQLMFTAMIVTHYVDIVLISKPPAILVLR